MNDIKFSVYTSGFNLIKNGFNFDAAFSNFFHIADEVVIAVNRADSYLTTDDGTLDEVIRWKEMNLGYLNFNNKKFKIVLTHFQYDDVTFDGAIKNEALQACSNEYCIQMDLDERFNLGQSKDLWELAAKALDVTDSDAILLPSIDLFGSYETIRSDKNIGFKFRLHKKTGIKRGVWKKAWLDSARTKFDTNLSDSTEPIYKDTEELVKTIYGWNPTFTKPIDLKEIVNRVPIVVHLGYVDYFKRIAINKEIWAKHWELRSGKKENVAVDINELENIPLIDHNCSFLF